jgi:hypothetical protein
MEATMRSPFFIYFAGVGTVVAALAVGFGGGLALTKTTVLKEEPAVTAARQERLRIAGKSDVTRIEADRSDPAKATGTSPSIASAAPVTTVQPTGTLMAVTTQTPVQAQPAATAQPVAAIQPPGAVASIPVQQKAEATERRDPDRKRQVAERTGRETARDTSYRREWTSDGVEDPSRAGTRTTVVRTYRSRSSGLFGLFAYDDED